MADEGFKSKLTANLITDEVGNSLIMWDDEG